MPFQVLFVPKVIHVEYKFDALDISLCIDLGDANSWGVGLVFDQVPPDYHYCAILVTGPLFSDI